MKPTSRDVRDEKRVGVNKDGRQKDQAGPLPTDFSTKMVHIGAVEITDGPQEKEIPPLWLLKRMA